MTVTVENTQVYAAIPSIEALVQDFFNFPTATEYEQIMDRVAVAVTSEESCVHPGTTSF